MKRSMGSAFGVAIGVPFANLLVGFVGRQFFGVDPGWGISIPVVIVSVAVEPDGDRAATEPFGELVLVVPAKRSALVLVTLRPHTNQLVEPLLTSIGQRRDTDRTITRKQINRGRDAIGKGDGALLHKCRLRNTAPLATPRLLRPGFGSGHLVDR